MEDTLRGSEKNKYVKVKRVLILVLMEDTLRVLRVVRNITILGVLILVLMEDTLREGLNNLTLNWEMS